LKLELSRYAVEIRFLEKSDFLIEQLKNVKEAK